MGLVLYRSGKPYVFEAIGTVQYTPLRRWVNRAQGSRYVVRRLKQAPTLLTTEAIRKLHAAARAFEGKRYDPTFEWSDDKIYCSELVWKVYERALGVHVGELQRLRDFDLSDPGVKAKMRQRYGRRVPLDEIVISPAAMYDWTGLSTVAEE